MSRPARTPNSCHREMGFTLIELLISLTLLGTILALLAGGLRLIAKDWDEHAGRADGLDAIARAADILERDAAGLQRVVASQSDETWYIFQGGSESLSFVSLEPPYPTRPGPYYIRYAAGPAGGLSRSRAPYRAHTLKFPGTTPANIVPLLDPHHLYSFSYGARAKDETRWTREWAHKDRLPDLIRLDISDARKGQLAAPSIVVRVRADAEIGCVGKNLGPCSAASEGSLGSGLEDGKQGEREPREARQ